jgi:hypothetical protein
VVFFARKILVCLHQNDAGDDKKFAVLTIPSSYTMIMSKEYEKELDNK